MPDVLIIDDDDIMRDMLLQMMEMGGVSAKGAENGEIAMKLVEKETFRLIITDIVMPEKEGLEVIMFLKKKVADLPVIAVSGGGRVNPDTYLNLSLKFGARYAFEKPFDREQFMNAVKSCLKVEI